MRAPWRIGRGDPRAISLARSRKLPKAGWALQSAQTKARASTSAPKGKDAATRLFLEGFARGIYRANPAERKLAQEA